MKALLAEPDIAATAVLSKRSKAYRTRADEIDAMTGDELLAAMIAEPTLIRRPLIMAEGRLVIGFDRDGLQSIVGDYEGSV